MDLLMGARGQEFTRMIVAMLGLEKSMTMNTTHNLGVSPALDCSDHHDKIIFVKNLGTPKHTKTVFLINLLGLFSGNCHNLSIHPIPIPPNPPQPPPGFHLPPTLHEKPNPGHLYQCFTKKGHLYAGHLRVQMLEGQGLRCSIPLREVGMLKWHPPYDMGKKHPAFECAALPKKKKTFFWNFFGQLLIAFWEIFRDLWIFLADIIATKPPNNPSQPPS